MKGFFQAIKQYIKENFRFLLVLVGLYFLLTFPLPYYIYTGGGIIPIEDRIAFDGTYVEKGSFNLAYVSEWRGTLATMLFSKFRSDWEVVPKEEYKMAEDEEEEEIFFRNKMLLEQANQFAIQLAYQQAEKPYKVKEKKYYVLYIYDREKTPLKVGDILKKVEGKPLTNLQDYQKEVSQTAIGDSLTLTVLRNQKEKEIKVEVYEKEGQKMTGISLMELDTIETDPKTELRFSKAESGPSGGLMTALAIYNRLTKKDLTNGKKIVGTGTIDSAGNVGEIGGVLYKLQGAVKAKADFFLVPSGENYESCKKEVKKKNYSIELIEVHTFEEAIQKLEKKITQ